MVMVPFSAVEHPLSKVISIACMNSEIQAICKDMHDERLNVIILLHTVEVQTPMLAMFGGVSGAVQLEPARRNVIKCRVAKDNR